MFADSVVNRVSSTINKMLYEVDTETSPALFSERLETLRRCLRKVVTLEDAWDVALSIANLWCPTPSSMAFEYNSVEYNTIEIFCLCVRRAYIDYY